MSTSFFFLFACFSTTSVPCTLVSIVWTGCFDDQLDADGGGEVDDDVARGRSARPAPARW